MACTSSEPRPALAALVQDAPHGRPGGGGPGLESPPAIRFERVSKHFGARRGLAHLSLEVAEGESLALVGVNGAGKSTCLKGMLDLCRLDSGSIEIRGVPHTEARSRSGLAFLPERFLPPWYLSGRQFLRYMARLQGAAWREDQVRSLCDRLDLAPESLTRPARGYSRGMGQKLGLAAAFLSGRGMLVLDEPMNGLDPRARLLAGRLLNRHRLAGGTLFFSSHCLEDLSGLCDRIAILHDGGIAFAGSAGQCRRRFGGRSLVDAFLRCVGPAPADAPRFRRGRGP